MPKSATRTPGGKMWPASLLATSTPNPSSRQKNVADSGDQDPLRFGGGRFLFFFGDGLHFGGRKEKSVAGLAHQADVPAGIFVHHDANVQLAFVILLNGFDGGDFAFEREIENIAAGARPQPDTVAALAPERPEFRADSTGVLSSRSLPFPFVHVVSPLAARSPRNAP